MRLEIRTALQHGRFHPFGGLGKIVAVAFVAVFGAVSATRAVGQTHPHAFVGQGCIIGGSCLPPIHWNIPLVPNPFIVPICASDPCSPKFDRNSTRMISEMMTYGGVGFSLGEVQEAEPGTQARGSANTYPTYYARSSDPTYTITCSRYGGCASYMPRNVHIPNGARASYDSDHHAIVVDLTQGYEIDLWEFNDNGTGHGTTNRISGGGSLSTGGVGVCHFADYADRGVCRGGGVAAGVNAATEVIDPREWIAGSIPHTVLVSVQCPAPVPDFLWPARHTDGGCSTGPWEGEYIWLDLADAQINRLPDLPWVKVLLHEMHDYGLMVVDSVNNKPGTYGPWELYGLDNYTMTLWGQPEPWTQFFKWVASQRQTVSYANNASHLSIPTTGITQSDLHIVQYNGP